MDLQKLKELGIDVDTGIGYFGHDITIYQKYLGRMLKSDYCQRVEARLDEGDVEGAFKAMHQLKTVVNYICIPSIIDRVSEMTETLRAGEAAGVMDGVRQVELVLKELSAEVDQMNEQ